MAEEFIIDYLTGQKLPDSDMERLRQRVVRFLVEEKGYAKEDIESRQVFQIPVENRIVTVTIDFLIKLQGKRLVLVQCYPTALITREKYTLACARLIEDYQIPFIAITDGFEAEVFEVPSGKLIGKDLKAIPDKVSLEKMLPELGLLPLNEERRIKERRILVAFDLLRCPCRQKSCSFNPSACA